MAATAHSNDHQLLEAWRDGDSRAGAELFARHWHRVARFFTTKIGPDCHQLIHQTFMACVDDKTRGRGDSSFRAFLFGVARRELLNLLRAVSCQGKHFVPRVLAAPLRSSTSLIASEHPPVRVLQAMGTLPVDTQLLLELHHWEQMTNAEIAAVVEIPADTVKARLRRARLELGQLLDTRALGANQVTLAGRG